MNQFQLALRRCFVLTSTLIVLGGTSVLHANDATVGGQGADLVLLMESRIRMVSEDIRLIQKQEHSTDWNVYAHYLFENPTSDSITVQMGFPETAHCSNTEEYGDIYDPRFRNLQTLVRGVPVQHSTGTVPANDWGFCLGTFYVFEVVFAPGEQLEVDHSYEYTGSSNVMGMSADYVTRTGSLWNGPIEEAVFTVVTAGPPVEAMWPTEYNLVEHYQDQFPTDPYGMVRTVYVFRQKDWLPTHDFFVELNTSYDGFSNPQCCPSRYWLHVLMRRSNPEEHIRKEVACLDYDYLRLCRNLVYARHGRPFADSTLQQLFYTEPMLDNHYDYIEEGTEFWKVGYQVNPRYSDDLLTKQEQEFVALLKKIEGERAHPGE